MSIRSRILALAATSALILLAVALSVDTSQPQPPQPDRSTGTIEHRLVQALREELRNQEGTTALDYAVKLEIVRDSPGWAEIRLVWQVLRADGTRIGAVEQNNLVPSEMLRDPEHEAWRWAASAASLGVIRLRETGDAYALIAR